MPLNDVGHLNATAGICGFTSALYAFYNRIGHDYLASLREPDRMVMEIRTYLQELQTAQNQVLLGDIEAFTRTFDGFEQFSITNYINRLAAYGYGATVNWDASFSIAMPPHVVVDYLRNRLGFANAAEVDTSAMAREAIVGVRRAAATPYNGLRHYFYVQDEKWYSWGEVFGSMADAVARKKLNPYTGYACKIIF